MVEEAGGTVNDINKFDMKKILISEPQVAQLMIKCLKN